MVAVGAALLSLLVAQAPGPAADPDPQYYICTVQPHGPWGGVTYHLNVPVDGSAPHHWITWGTIRHPGGFYLQVQWHGPTPPAGGRMDERAWFSASFTLDRRVRGEARIEIRRAPGERHGVGFAYAGAFGPIPRIGGTSTYSVTTQGRWGELLAWLAGRESVTFALVRRDGTMVAEQRLDADMLAAATAAIAQARVEVEAMARNYRERCAVPEEIVVT